MNNSETIPGTDIPRPTVDIGDGNAFAIMANCRRALKRAGAPSEVVEEYTTKSKAGDHDNLLAVAMDYCEVE